MSPYRKGSSQRTIRLIAVAVLGIALLWFLFSWIRTFRGTIPPVYGDTLALTAHSKQSLIKKVTALQSQIDAQQAFLVTLSTLESENAALKAELDRTPEIKGTLARVIVPPNHSIYDTILLDIGIEEGVTIGQNVYAFGSIALGTISDVLSHTSTVLLYSASGRETSATTTGSDLTVTLIGRGGGEYEVRMPRDIAFQEGGVISQQSLAVHPLATIQKIITDPRDPFQRLLAKVPVNLQTMKWVVVK